jgi:hypothetical protein
MTMGRNVRENGTRRPAPGATPFEVTRVRKDQHSNGTGRSVYLRFYVIGPPGMHAVNAAVSGFTGQQPQLKHDRELHLDEGATGHIDIRLEFGRERSNSCTLAITVGNQRLGAFLIEPAVATRRAG